MQTDEERSLRKRLAAVRKLVRAQSRMVEVYGVKAATNMYDFLNILESALRKPRARKRP